MREKHQQKKFYRRRIELTVLLSTTIHGLLCFPPRDFRTDKRCCFFGVKKRLFIHSQKSGLQHSGNKCGSGSGKWCVWQTCYAVVPTICHWFRAVPTNSLMDNNGLSAGQNSLVDGDVSYVICSGGNSRQQEQKTIFINKYQNWSFTSWKVFSHHIILLPKHRNRFEFQSNENCQREMMRKSPLLRFHFQICKSPPISIPFEFPYLTVS